VACGTFSSENLQIQSCGPISGTAAGGWRWGGSWDLFENEIVALKAMDSKRTCSGLQLPVKKQMEALRTAWVV
jgi:hypothetical protein